MEEENILVYREKAYYTLEELKLYYQLAIAESLKQGNDSMAEHYRILLDYLNDEDKHENKLSDMIIKHKNNKK